MRYEHYADAYDEAHTRANMTGLDVAIRKTKEFGKVGFNVSFAAINDSDYALAENRRTGQQSAHGAKRRTENSVETIGFYVTVIDGPRKGFLLGPYATHAEALANVERGRTLADKADARAHWYAFGTAKITGTQRGTVFGQ